MSSSAVPATLRPATLHAIVFGRVLRHLCAARGWDAKTGAAHAQVETHTWARYLRGDVSPTVSRVAAFCRLIGLDPVELHRATESTVAALRVRGVFVIEERPESWSAIGFSEMDAATIDELIRTA